MKRSPVREHHARSARTSLLPGIILPRRQYRVLGVRRCSILIACDQSNTFPRAGRVGSTSCSVLVRSLGQHPIAATKRIERDYPTQSVYLVSRRVFGLFQLIMMDGSHNSYKAIIHNKKNMLSNNSLFFPVSAHHPGQEPRVQQPEYAAS